MDLPIASALVLGALHTFETDHLAAVGALVARRPGPVAAMRYGVRWAAGHGGIVLLAGGALLMLGVTVPDAVGVWLERLVGVSLVGLGVWVVASAVRARGEPRASAAGHGGAGTHSLVHLHAHPHPDRDAHAATAIGALHGLAGSAPLIALLPIARGSSLLEGSAFLLAFGVGTALAMAAYALVAGALVQGAARRWSGSGWGFTAAAGIGTTGVGVWWMAFGAG